MVEYYIDTIVIKGVAFKSKQPLELLEAVTLARELNSRGYTFHIKEKISDFKYEMRTLRELEQLVE